MEWWNKIKAWFDFNKDGAVTEADLNMAKGLANKKFKEANQAINEVVDETKRRAKRAKQELKDVGVAAKEVVNQAGDVVDAVTTSKKRPGRKKKTD